MKVKACGLTDVGRKRTRNEDSYLINEDLNIVILADGMGGHLGGEFASKMAVTTIEEVIDGMTTDPEATVISGVNCDDADYGDQLRHAIEVASEKIFDRAMYDSSLKGMGTTTVAALFNGGYVYIGNVGDSRAYLIHANKIKLLTSDHSLVNEQLQAGVITEEEVKKHKLKNIITRSVGFQQDVKPDVERVKLFLGDKILLCSDGLSNHVEEETIQEYVANFSSEEACRKLVDLANEKGGDDNITVVLAEVVDLDE